MVLTRARRGSESTEQGAVAIIVALFAVVMFGLSALVVDLGVARDTRREAQNAADAAALAAAGALYDSTGNADFAAATAAAKSYAAVNFGTDAGEWASCAADALAYAPSTPCISFDSPSQPSAVRVVLPSRKTPSGFGALFGYQGLSVTALAQAQVGSHGLGAACKFCVLGAGPHDLQNGNLEVHNGDIWINGNVSIGSNGALAATTVNVSGTVNQPSKVTGTLNQHGVTATDPLAGTDLPDTTGLAFHTDPCSQGPGRYGAVSLSGSGACTLSPGLYVFTDPLSISGSKSFRADGVTLYFTCGASGTIGSCGSDYQPGALDQGGGGTFRVTAPASGATAGTAIVYARDNPAALSLHGSGTLQLSGTVYALSSTIDITGGSCITPQSAMVVVNDFAFSGQGSCFSTEYVPVVDADAPSTSPGLVL